jgi:hypothetical protein
MSHKLTNNILTSSVTNIVNRQLEIEFSEKEFAKHRSTKDIDTACNDFAPWSAGGLP